MGRKSIALALAAAWLGAMPVEAAVLTSATISFVDISRVLCGVTYRGRLDTTVQVEILEFGDTVLDAELSLSPESPAGWWSTTRCPEGGCLGPWCRVTTTQSKALFRASMCVETGLGNEPRTPITCIPVE